LGCVLDIHLAAADLALADDTFILATGRRDPRIYAIDLRAALKRHNNNTPNAIVSRSKVHPDRLDGTPVGDPRHRPERGSPHGIRDQPSRTGEQRGVPPARRARKRLGHEREADARSGIGQYRSRSRAQLRQRLLRGGRSPGPSELLLVSHSENWLTEDGSNRISLIDRNTGGRRGQIEMALGHPGHACPSFPVPFGLRLRLLSFRFATPDPQFGCWPNPEFLALGAAATERPTCSRATRARTTCP